MSFSRFFSAAAVAVAFTGAPQAAEIRVLTAGAFKTVLLAVVPEFEKQSGHTVRLDNDTAGGLAKRIAGGEAFDLAVLTPAGLESLVKLGKVADGSVAPLARAGVGVAVKAGAPKPDISSVEAFRAALLGARAVAYIDPAAGGSSGIYFAQLLEKWGIADRVKPKAVLVAGGLVAEKLVSGEADLAIHQISEILAVPGATLVGPIPAEVQNYTVYAAGLSASPASASSADAARALLSALRAAPASAIMKAKGLEAQ